MTTILSDFFAKVISKLMIVSTTNNENNNEKNKKLFTIQYIKEEPNKIQSDKPTISNNELLNNIMVTIIREVYIIINYKLAVKLLVDFFVSLNIIWAT